MIAGYSINMLTMFGMVLAVGILVDDAIVVVENVERIMAEEGLPPKEATRKAMSQITGAIIGITLVLIAVFVPMAFFPGSVGIIYRQFSVTMVAAIAFSALLAMSLTPALCATLLKQVKAGDGHSRKGVFGWFNRRLDATRDGYSRNVGRSLKRTGRLMLIYAALLIGLTWAFIRLPGGFLPVDNLGNSSGFSFRLQDRGQKGNPALAAAADRLIAEANASPVLQKVYIEGLPPAPQVNLMIDREKAGAFGVTFEDINNTISTNLGSNYINDFPNRGRLQRVIVQADRASRMTSEDLLNYNVKNSRGQLVPLSAFAGIEGATGPTQI